MKGFIFLAFSHVSSVLSFKQWAMYAGFVYSFHVKILKLCLNASHIIGPWDSYTILKLIPVSVCTVCLVNNPIFYTSVLSFLDSVTTGSEQPLSLGVKPIFLNPVFVWGGGEGLVLNCIIKAWLTYKQNWPLGWRHLGAPKPHIFRNYVHFCTTLHVNVRIQGEVCAEILAWISAGSNRRPDKLATAPRG